MERKEKRIVVKIGTSVIIKNGNGLDRPFIDGIARQAAYLKENCGIQIIIVSSGAIASGREIEPLLTAEVTDKQVAAMFGQPELMTAWRSAFQKQKLIAGEALLKDEDLDNFRKPLLRALGFGVVVINGNDATYDPNTEQKIISADNDSLSRYVAHITGANRLILLTETEGALDRNKKVIGEIACVEDLQRIDYFKKTQGGTGGPSSKVDEARQHITSAEKIAYIAGARVEDVIIRIVNGERIGTQVTLPLQGYFNI